MDELVGGRVRWCENVRKENRVIRKGNMPVRKLKLVCGG